MKTKTILQIFQGVESQIKEFFYFLKIKKYIYFLEKFKKKRSYS